MIPVPSRLLSKNLGMNTIPPNVSSYACLCSRSGPATRLQKDRGDFYPVEKISKDMQRRVLHLQRKSERLDCRTIALHGRFPPIRRPAGAEVGDDEYRWHAD